jgi:predicted Holliday junction resolvase-like endonuclease
MNNWIIVIAIIVAVIALLVCCFRYIKKKIRNKVINITTDIITETTGKYLDEKTASKVNYATNITAETLKKGDAMKTVAKKGLEIAFSAAKKNLRQ